MLTLARHVAETLKRRESAVMVTLVNARGVDCGMALGAKLLVTADARTQGSLGSAMLDRAAREQAVNVIEEGEPRLEHYLPDGTPAPRS